MLGAIVASISHGGGIKTAVALRAVFDRLLALRLVGDHRTEKQADRCAGRDRAGVSTTATATVTMATTATVAMALHLHDQRIIAGLRRQILRHGAGQRRRTRWRRANQQTCAEHCSSCE